MGWDRVDPTVPDHVWNKARPGTSGREFHMCPHWERHEDELRRRKNFEKQDWKDQLDSLD